MCSQVAGAGAELRDVNSEVGELRRHIACLEGQLLEARAVIQTQHTVMTAAALAPLPASRYSEAALLAGLRAA
jgi:hypothetical protein